MKNKTRIYVTHCSAKKDDSLKCTNKKVPPDKLYTSPRIKGFIRICKEKKVTWAIFSDLYGVWFPDIRHQWYEKDPDTIVKNGKVIDPVEFTRLVNDFNKKLLNYDEIWFYRHPYHKRVHCLYRMLLQETTLKEKIKLIGSIKEIV